MDIPKFMTPFTKKQNKIFSHSWVTENALLTSVSENPNAVDVSVLLCGILELIETLHQAKFIRSLF